MEWVHDEASVIANKRRTTIAARQHGVIRARQLGLTGCGIAWRVKNGTLHRKYRGVYAYGHQRLSQKGEWLAAVYAAGQGAALASLSAGVLLQVSRFRETGSR